MRAPGSICCAGRVRVRVRVRVESEEILSLLCGSFWLRLFNRSGRRTFVTVVWSFLYFVRFGLLAESKYLLTRIHHLPQTQTHNNATVFVSSDSPKKMQSDLEADQQEMVDVYVRLLSKYSSSCALHTRCNEMVLFSFLPLLLFWAPKTNIRKVIEFICECLMSRIRFSLPAVCQQVLCRCCLYFAPSFESHFLDYERAKISSFGRSVI